MTLQRQATCARGPRRIAVITQTPAGSHFAHAINVVKTTGGFARLGWEALVLCEPPDEGASEAELRRRYGEPTLRWRWPSAGSAPSDASPEAFARWALAQAEAFDADAIYARHFEAAIAASNRSRPVALETHAHIGDANPALQRALERVRPDGRLALITISPALAAHYIERGAAAERVSVAADGVDVEMFARALAEDCEPPDERLRPTAARIVYSGHLYDYKGAPTILDAAALAPHLRFLLLGGTDADIARVRGVVARRRLGNAHALGRVAHSETPRWLAHADALLLPPSALHPSARWTSPVKLGEYLATGKPIVASAVPALRELLPADAAQWFTPDDPRSMIRAIEAALEAGQDENRRRAALALALARRWSYPERARRILAAMGLAPARGATRGLHVQAGAARLPQEAGAGERPRAGR